MIPDEVEPLFCSLFASQGKQITKGVFIVAILEKCMAVDDFAQLSERDFSSQSQPGMGFEGILRKYFSDLG